MLVVKGRAVVVVSRWGVGRVVALCPAGGAAGPPSAEAGRSPGRSGAGAVGRGGDRPRLSALGSPFRAAGAVRLRERGRTTARRWRGAAAVCGERPREGLCSLDKGRLRGHRAAAFSA